MVFEHAGNRPLFFSSFDCDVVTLLRLKQPRYPVCTYAVLICAKLRVCKVFFLTDGQPSPKDYLQHDLRAAAQFATACMYLLCYCLFNVIVRLRGLVTKAKTVLESAGMVPYVHERGLMLLTYGEEKYAYL